MKTTNKDGSNTPIRTEEEDTNCSGRISKQYKRNIYNFKRKTLWTTIAVKLFDSMSNIVNIPIDTALD